MIYLDNDPTIEKIRWVLRLFRPILRELNVQDLPVSPSQRVVTLFNNKNFITNNMGKCIITIRQGNFNPDIMGYYILLYNSTHDIFILIININQSLAGKEGAEKKVLQKIVAVHEFVHCLAALLSIKQIESKSLIKSLQNRLQKKIHFTTEVKLGKLLQELDANLTNTVFKSQDPDYVFPDEHFRLGYEDFPVSYPVIYRQFLLSRDLFEEYFTKTMQKQFNELINRGENVKAITLFSPIISKLIEEKALTPNFIKRRMQEEFLPHYYLFHYKKRKP